MFIVFYYTTAYVQACKLKEPQWLNNVAHTSFAPKDACTAQQGMPHMQPLHSKQYLFEQI